MNSKFSSKFEIKENGCWEWTKEKDQWGYGVLHIYQGKKRIKRISASKASWILKNEKEIPQNMLVCHHCDNRLCVNPDHLFLGTCKDNMQDCKNKDRLFKGNKSRKHIYKKYDKVEDRFLSKIEKKNNACWEWTSSRDKSGYGVFLYEGKVKFAHRISWILFVGEIGNKIICHKCDNRLCVNPQHLFIGTHKENAIDCSSKKRNIAQTNPEKIPKGENHGNSKLKNTIVLEIVEKSSTMTLEEVSQFYNLKKEYIRKILRGDIWSSVTLIHKRKYVHKRKNKKEWLAIAEQLANKNNGKLPKGLRKKGFASLENCIYKHPDFFKHLCVKN